MKAVTKKVEETKEPVKAVVETKKEEVKANCRRYSKGSRREERRTKRSS